MLFDTTKPADQILGIAAINKQSILFIENSLSNRLSILWQLRTWNSQTNNQVKIQDVTIDREWIPEEFLNLMIRQFNLNNLFNMDYKSPDLSDYSIAKASSAYDTLVSYFKNNECLLIINCEVLLPLPSLELLNCVMDDIKGGKSSIILTGDENLKNLINKATETHGNVFKGYTFYKTQ
jgi:hypothetical protein